MADHPSTSLNVLEPQGYWGTWKAVWSQSSGVAIRAGAKANWRGLSGAVEGQEIGELEELGPEDVGGWG